MYNYKIIILIPFHIGLSSQDGVGYLRKPQLNEMLSLLRRKSSEWHVIGAALGLSLNKRESIKNSKALYDHDRLQYVLNTWLETSREQSNDTWGGLYVY